MSNKLETFNKPKSSIPTSKNVESPRSGLDANSSPVVRKKSIPSVPLPSGKPVGLIASLGMTAAQTPSSKKLNIVSNNSKSIYKSGLHGTNSCNSSNDSLRLKRNVRSALVGQKVIGEGNKSVVTPAAAISSERENKVKDSPKFNDKRKIPVGINSSPLRTKSRNFSSPSSGRKFDAKLTDKPSKRVSDLMKELDELSCVDSVNASSVLTNTNPDNTSLVTDTSVVEKNGKHDTDISNLKMDLLNEFAKISAVGSIENLLNDDTCTTQDAKLEVTNPSSQNPPDRTVNGNGDLEKDSHDKIVDSASHDSSDRNIKRKWKSNISCNKGGRTLRSIFFKSKGLTDSHSESSIQDNASTHSQTSSKVNSKRFGFSLSRNKKTEPRARDPEKEMSMNDSKLHIRSSKDSSPRKAMNKKNLSHKPPIHKEDIHVLTHPDPKMKTDSQSDESRPVSPKTRQSIVLDGDLLTEINTTLSNPNDILTIKDINETLTSSSEVPTKDDTFGSPIHMTPDEGIDRELQSVNVNQLLASFQSDLLASRSNQDEAHPAKSVNLLISRFEQGS